MPRGYDNMFFALFGITNRAVSTQHSFNDHLPQVFLPFTNSTTAATVLHHRTKRHPSHHQRHTE